jgi:hypothetical protein
MAPLLDFSNPLVTDASQGQTPEPGSGVPADPAASGILFPAPAVTGAVTGVVNALGRSVQGFFTQLPQDLGLATPASVSPFAALGGMGMGTILLIGLGVYFLASQKRGR